MRHSALSSTRKLLWAAAIATCLFFTTTPCQAQPDPPAQAGRISFTGGIVSFQPAGSDNFGQAFVNLPLGPGDRIVTDESSRAEIQIGQTYVRIGANADVTLINSTSTGIYFGLAQGSVHIATRGLWEGQSIFVNTPNGSATDSMPGQLRVDVLPDEGAALFSAYGAGNEVLLTGAGGFSQYIGEKQSMELAGSNPVVPQWMQPADWDSLDNWSTERDNQIAQSASFRYVSAEIAGASELDAAGTWQPGTPYGAVWFPNVPGGWAPYHNGHWINHAPWGWVWVEDESWGYAPFHYGRWVSIGGRWGWVPGPPAAHPVWSPALVVFAGGRPGVSAWIPLGPGEPYRPWYPCSPHYIDVVNVSNITVTPTVHVQASYANFNFGAVVFANRTIGVTAVSNDDFAAGRPSAKVAVVVDVHIFEHVQVMAAPEPRPTPQSIIGHAPARPVRVSAARPVLINEKGKAVSAAPGAKPVEPPVKPAPQIKALPGRKAIAPPPGAAKGQPGKTPAAVAPKPGEKPAPPTASKPAAPAPAATTTPKPADKTATPASGKPATEPAPKPGDKPVPPAGAKPVAPAATATPKPVAPAPATTPKPADKTAPPAGTKPAPPATTTTPKPGEKPAPATKPAPPAKSDKEKKAEKDKKDEKKPE
jgi:hypothetical protein